MARVIIMGATSAIATEVAERYAARGDALYLVARDDVALTALARSLASAVVGSESGDFRELDQNAGRVARALECLGGFDVAVVAHGDLGDQQRSEHEWAAAKESLVVNGASVISLLIPLANAIEQQGRGQIAVLSSVAADRGRPRNYTYAAGKAAVNVYMQGLRSRLWKSGGRVHILKLGPTHTPMTTNHPKNALFAEPGDVADGIVRAIDRNVSEAYVPGYWRPIMTIVRHLPEPIFQRLSFLSGR